jgi:hypothetical protein
MPRFAAKAEISNVRRNKAKLMIPSRVFHKPFAAVLVASGCIAGLADLCGHQTQLCPTFLD